MENRTGFANGIEYLDRLIYLGLGQVQCCLAESGCEMKEGDCGPTRGRAELKSLFENAFSTAHRQLKEGHFLPLEYLFNIFDCDSFERHAVIITLLTQVLPDTAAYFALLNHDQNMGFSTPFALCQTYEKQGDFIGHSPYFAQGSKLSEYFFAEKEIGVCSRVSLDRRILAFILGTCVKESYYIPVAVLWGPDDPVEDRGFVDAEVVAGLLTYIGNGTASALHSLFNLCGEKGAGRRSCIKHIAGEYGLNLMFIDMGYLLYDKEPIVLIDKIVRECLIFQAVPVITNLAQDTAPGQRTIILHLLGVIADYFDYSFIITEQQLQPDYLKENILLVTAHLGKVSLKTSVRLWEMESRKYKVDKKVSFHELAGEFTLTPGQIRASFKAARTIAEMSGDKAISLTELKRGCYNSLQFSMGSKAFKLEPVYTWDDLVLPLYQKDLLLTACDQVRHKYTVYQEWGFQEKMSYGKNVSMLFTGPPGTGKTMAAQVVSHELGLDVYKVELATVVSKYVGETEKNLNEIFQQATKSQVILFFDEADILFSKRTEVKDSNDKYSNMEAAFLLQKMEEYDGVTILATNYIQNFDEAFKRRIKFVIDFPFPNQNQRYQIWQKVFPEQLPLGELDYDYLTSKFELSGSNIKNIALHSAFLAAAEGSGKVEMKHLIAAIRNEFAKSGKMFTKEDAGEYYVLLEAVQGVESNV